MVPLPRRHAKAPTTTLGAHRPDRRGPWRTVCVVGAALGLALAAAGCESRSTFTNDFAAARAAYAAGGYTCSEPGGASDRIPFSVTQCVRRTELIGGVTLYGMLDGRVGGIDITPPGGLGADWAATEPVVVEALTPLMPAPDVATLAAAIHDHLGVASMSNPVSIARGLELRLGSSIYLWTPELVADIEQVLGTPAPGPS